MAELSMCIVFVVVVGANFPTASAEKPAFGGGQIGNNLVRGLIQGDGLLNKLTVGVSDGLNDAICNLIGPNFLRAALTDNDCLSGIELPTLFKSYKCYCEIFNRLSPNKRKCLSNAAARIQIELRSVIKLDLLLTKCCRTCDDYKSHNLVRFGISNEGLVGGLLSDLVDGTNQFVCTTLGSNFLQILLDHCRDCRGRTLSPTAFKSFKSFCPYFNSETRKNRKCITDGVALIEFPSIFQWTEIIGKCCTECTGNDNNLPQSPASCKRTNGKNIEGYKNGC